MPTSIIIISCLEDFYGQVRGVLAQSYIDRIEKSGPVALLETRVAKLRLFRVPELLSLSFVLALLSVISSFVLR